ncbi:MAG TPA: hypothetical protein VLK35_19700 [Methylomirabilota bacterium]|nr:hypothetical protein [Methylomirabilota bacterium]
MLNQLAWGRAMPIGVSCLLHVGLIGGLVVGQHWLVSAVAVKLPVRPVQLEHGTLSWYTEGSDIRPDLRFAVSRDGRHFGRPKRLHTSATSIPGQALVQPVRIPRAR